MKKSLLPLLAVTVSTMASAHAHPGHPGHEDWPFDDFSWSTVAACTATVILAGLILRKKRRSESTGNE